MSEEGTAVVMGYLDRYLSEGETAQKSELGGGLWYLAFEGVNVYLTIEGARDWFSIVADVCTVTSLGEEKDDVFRTLLTLNYGPSGNGAFSVDEQRDAVCFRGNRNIEGLDWSEFEALLGNVLAVTRQVKEANGF